MRIRLLALLAITIVAVAFAWPRPAVADSHEHGLTKVFTDVYVRPDETIDGDVNVIFGNATIAGRVRGDVNTIFGSCTTDEGAQIDGEEHCVPNDTARAMAPWLIPRAFAGPFAEDRGLFEQLVSSAIVVVVFLLFPLRMRIALDRVERHPALCALAGAIAAVAMVPIGLLLVVSLIGIPLVLLEIAAVFAGVWIGTGAIALVIGRRLCELSMPSATPSPLVALIIGLIVVAAAEIAPFIGWAVTALMWLVGLGASVLTFVRATRLGGVPGGAAAGGPPMRASRF